MRLINKPCRFWKILFEIFQKRHGFSVDEDLQLKQLEALTNKEMRIHMGKTNESMMVYDRLTGLPNLNLFKSKIRELIHDHSGDLSAGRNPFAIIHLDIDHFRYLVEAFGSEAGDAVLQHVADYLNSLTEDPSYYVSRTAFDEFAIICTGVPSRKELMLRVDEILNNVCQLCPTKYIYYITLSAGVALYPDNGENMDALMLNAEIATYLAKKSGENYKIYSNKLHRDIMGHIHMVNRLQEGIEREEFTLYYQPEYKLATNEIIGVEALIRWPQPTKKDIPPDLFIPIAEKSKQIYALERWIISTALNQKLTWEREGLEHIELSINLSSKTLESESNFQRIEELITSYEIDYSRVTIEITETMIITNVELAIEKLTRLRSYGIKIALDDFGRGYYSLNNLLKLPIDIIKIDRSFIKSIPEANEETAITRNILSMARDLNYMVVAEGIETREQLEYLRENDCERGQGYLLCTPLPIDQINEILRNF